MTWSRGTPAPYVRPGTRSWSRQVLHMPGNKKKDTKKRYKNEKRPRTPETRLHTETMPGCQPSDKEEGVFPAPSAPFPEKHMAKPETGQSSDCHPDALHLLGWHRFPAKPRPGVLPPGLGFRNRPRTPPADRHVHQAYKSVFHA